MMWQKILVALDFSDITDTVFDRALTLAKLTGATLILLNVLPPDREDRVNPALYSIEYPVVPEVYQKILEENQKQWQALQEKNLLALEAMKEKAAESGVDAKTVQIFGDPGNVICKQAKEFTVDLIAIGNRGLSGLKELFLGSVSNYVTHHASCSVLIIRNCNREKKLESDRLVDAR